MFRRISVAFGRTPKENVEVDAGDPTKVIQVEIVGAKLNGLSTFPDKTWISASIVGAKIQDLQNIELQLETKTNPVEALNLGASTIHRSYVCHGIYIQILSLVI